MRPAEEIRQAVLVLQDVAFVDLALGDGDGDSCDVICLNNLAPVVAWLTLAAEDYRSRECMRKPGEPPRAAWVDVIGYDPAPIDLLTEESDSWQAHALRFARRINKAVPSVRT